MSRLFLSGKLSACDELRRSPSSASAEKLCRDVVVATRVPHVNEQQLAAATGGAEASCSRCTLPFAAVLLVAGAVVTGVAYALNSHRSNISVLGLSLLAAAAAMLAAAAACWRIRHANNPEQRRQSHTALINTSHSLSDA